MPRNYKKFIKDSQEIDNYSIVVSRDEIVALRKKYDGKYSLKANKLQNVDVFNGKGLLQGVKLSWGEWQ